MGTWDECFRLVRAYAAKTREGRFVLGPDPKVVRRLLTRYATLRIAQAERYSPATARELEEVGSTLCGMTGASRVRDAIALADDLLDRARPAAGRTPEADGESGLPLAV
jgi:hypothetical protein